MGQVNKSLLPNSTLEPGFPRQISVETAQKWLPKMGFEVLTARKGLFIDGHERLDVMESRETFSRKMVKLVFLLFVNAPTELVRQLLREDFDPPIREREGKKLLFDNETTFQSNEDQSSQCGG